MNAEFYFVMPAGASSAAGAGAADGSSSVAGVGAALAAGAGSVSCSASVTGNDASVDAGAGTIGASASVAGVGASLAATAGLATASSTAAGVSEGVTADCAGSADGSSACSGVGFSSQGTGGPPLLWPPPALYSPGEEEKRPRPWRAKVLLPAFVGRAEAFPASASAGPAPPRPPRLRPAAAPVAEPAPPPPEPPFAAHVELLPFPVPWWQPWQRRLRRQRKIEDALILAGHEDLLPLGGILAGADDDP